MADGKDDYKVFNSDEEGAGTCSSVYGYIRRVKRNSLARKLTLKKIF